MRHPTNASIEAYAWSNLKSPRLEKMEEHLLHCEVCRMRVSAEDRVRETRQQMDDHAVMESADQPGDSPVNYAHRALYDKRIPARIFQYRTHLPVYSLEVAAGIPGKQLAEIKPEGWVAVAPGPILLTRDMFVTHITGSSMEPLIPDGSLCAFWSDVSHPYDGKILLLEDYEETGGNRYSVKRYCLSRNADPTEKEDPGWLHERFTLESLNADAPIEIASARKINVIGEFVFTLP